MATKATTTGALKAGVRDAALDPWPIPAEQVLEGDPQASGLLLWKSDDSTLANGIWECTPGRFTWVHADETLCLVDGKVTVTRRAASRSRSVPATSCSFPKA